MKVYKEGETTVEELKKRSLLSTMVFIFFLCVLFIAFFTYHQIYKQHQNTPTTRWIASVIPLPAGSVNGSLFFYKELFAFDTLAQYEEKEDHFMSGIDAIVRQKLIRQVAREVGVVAQIENPEQDMWSQYGWSYEQYVDYVLEPLALVSAADAFIYASEAHQQDVLDEMQKVVALSESGISFEDLAVQYSEAASASLGGDVGYICIENIDERLKGNWMEDEGVISDIVELDDRFVLVTAYDRIDSEDPELCSQIGFQTIVLYKNTLADVLEQYKEQAVVKIYGE